MQHRSSYVLQNVFLTVTLSPLVKNSVWAQVTEDNSEKNGTSESQDHIEQSGPIKKLITLLKNI